jgi:hypothetical protein
MYFQKRYLEENSFWRTALPLGGLIGGAYLGHELGHDFGQGVVDQIKHETSLEGVAKEALGHKENLKVDKAIENLIKLKGGSVYDIGKAVGHESLGDKSNLIDKLSTRVDDENAQRFVKSVGQRAALGGAALGGLTGLAVRPSKNDRSY